MITALQAHLWIIGITFSLITSQVNSQNDDEYCSLQGYQYCLDMYGECTSSYIQCSTQCQLNQQCSYDCCFNGYCAYTHYCGESVDSNPTPNNTPAIVLPFLFSGLFLIVISIAIYIRKRMIETSTIQSEVYHSNNLNSIQQIQQEMNQQIIQHIPPIYNQSSTTIPKKQSFINNTQVNDQDQNKEASIQHSSFVDQKQFMQS